MRLRESALFLQSRAVSNVENIHGSALFVYRVDDSVNVWLASKKQLAALGPTNPCPTFGIRLKAIDGFGEFTEQGERSLGRRRSNEFVDNFHILRGAFCHPNEVFHACAETPQGHPAQVSRGLSSRLPVPA